VDLITKTLKDYKIPIEIVLSAFFIICVVLLCIPDHFVIVLKLEDFLNIYGNYIGIAAIASGMLLAILIIRRVFLYLRISIQTAKKEKTREKAIRNSINTLDNYEKAVLREFFIQKRNTVQVPEEDTAVVGLLKKGIISTVGDPKFLLGVGWVYPVSLSPSVQAILSGSNPQIIGFPPGEPTPEKIREINNLRPNFVWRIEGSN
jgi:hypothetical protein